MSEMEFNDDENDPEGERNLHIPLEIIVLAVVMAASVILAMKNVIDNSTSIVISGLIILYCVFGIYRR